VVKLICYTLGGEPPTIRPAPLERVWMDRTPDQFAYRCLPLNIANAHGWELLCPASFVAIWNGGAGIDAISIVSDAPKHKQPVSHFGSGVLTFHVNCLFRTEPGIDLHCTGPANRPKPGISPLQGFIETDWAPYSFTMNWLFTDPNRPVAFAAGEPYCLLFPVPRDLIEATEPVMMPLSSDPETEAAYRALSQGRQKFNAELKVAGSKAREDKWQKGYFRGRLPDGSPAPAEHRTKVRVRPFAPPERDSPEGG